MKRTVILLFFIFSLQIAFSQEFEMIRHQVQLGETVRMISKKYKIEPSEIYKLNKFAIDGISQGMVLQLMVPKKEAPAATVETTDNPTDTTQSAPDAQPGESVVTTTTKKVTTVKKKHSSGDEQPADAAQDLPVVATSENTVRTVSHTVGKGETLFSIAKRYGVSVEELKSQNAALQEKGLQSGQVLTIVTTQGGEIVEKTTDNVVENDGVPKENSVSSGNAGNTQIMHTVLKGETLYSLARKYNVSVDAIQMQNEQALKKGLQVGQVLVIGIAK